MVFVRDEKGFTLVELMVTFVILLLVLAILYSTVFNGFLTYERLEKNVDSQQSLRLALDRVVRELRAAKSLAAGAGTLKTGGILHQYHLDEQNLFFEKVDGTVVWYYLKGSDLRYAVKEQGATQFTGHNPVASGIAFLFFEYNREPVEASSCVTMIIKGMDEDGSPYELRSTAYLRIKGNR